MLWLRPLRDPAAQGAEHEIPPVFPNAQGREAFLREPPTMYNNHEELFGVIADKHGKTCKLRETPELA